jgi:hypothetical protein
VDKITYHPFFAHFFLEIFLLEHMSTEDDHDHHDGVEDDEEDSERLPLEPEIHHRTTADGQGEVIGHQNRVLFVCDM